MAEEKKSVILYVDIISTFESMTDKEAGRLIKHYLRYVNDLNPEPPDKITQIAFEPIKQQLKRDLVKWECIKHKRSEAGKVSAELRKQKATNPTSVESVEQTSTNPTVSVNGNVSVNVNDNVINTERENTAHAHEKSKTEIVSLKTKEKYNSPGEKIWNTRPGISQIDLQLPARKLMSVVELFKITKSTDVDVGQVEGLWSIFKSQNFNEEKFYQSESEVYKHFMNWCKSQSIQKHGTHQQSFTKPANRKSAGAEQLAASLKDDITNLARS